jgi:hypothetical protein
MRFEAAKRKPNWVFGEALARKSAGQRRSKIATHELISVALSIAQFFKLLR